MSAITIACPACHSQNIKRVTYSIPILMLLINTVSQLIKAFAKNAALYGIFVQSFLNLVAKAVNPPSYQQIRLVLVTLKHVCPFMPILKLDCWLCRRFTCGYVVFQWFKHADCCMTEVGARAEQLGEKMIAFTAYFLCQALPR